MEFVEYIKSPRIDNAFLKRRHGDYEEGTLCITGHHIIFSSRKDHKEELFLLHCAVESLEKRIITGQVGIMTICCKNFDLFKMKFPNTEEMFNVASSIEALSVIDNNSLKYPFFYRHLQSLNEDGWDMFSTEIEFSQMCASTQNWKISHINADYKTCPSYPSSVIVPACISDDEIKASAQFRHGGRFPVLSYYHKPTEVSLVRCGQPLISGVVNKRCKEDEKLVNAALNTQKKGMIVDTRTPTAQLNSRGKGGGIEPESNYPQWKRVNHNIEKYSGLNDGIAKLVEASLDHTLSMNSWLSKLESSGWLDQVQCVLSSACFVANCLDKEGVPVLIHGDSGCDATLQVTSLVQVMLQPSCRTLRGFQGLIDREWLRAGHPFATRCIKVGVSPNRYKGQGPVFLLFLDCVYQIYQQFPCSFEFNDKFLLFIQEHVYYSQFGTFLCNNEMQRSSIKLKENTVSLWSYVNQDSVYSSMLNPMYEMNVSPIYPSIVPQSLGLWTGVFAKWQRSLGNEEHFWKEVKRVQTENKELKDKALSLRRVYAELQASVMEHLGLQ